MTAFRRSVFVLALLASTSACGKKDTDPGPGGVTVGEARTLDEAAEMLDARQLPARQIDDQASTAATGKAPASPAASDGPAG